MWVFNIILFLFWMFSPVIYQEAVDVGATCWAYRASAGEQPSAPPPPCPYGDDGVDNQ
jgi:hypothetical protein